MLRDFDFSFTHSLLAVTLPSRYEEDAILHTLPPEPYSLKSSAVKHSPPLTDEYVNITLGNSPEYNNSFYPPKPVYTISNFNKKVEETSKSKNKVFSRSKQSPNVKRSQLPFAHKEARQKLFEQIKTEREENSKGSRVNVSSTLHNQSTARNPREDTLYPQPKRKFGNKQGQASQSPDKLALVNKIQELKSRLTEGENLNRTLGMQLQITREKLKVRESEQIILHERMEAMGRQIEEGRLKQRQIIQLKRMNDYFCEEIDKQKAEVVRYEQKNQESLRLLQQLNENITKREEKLQRELAQQASNNSKLSGDNAEVQGKLHKALQHISQLQSQFTKLEEINAEKDKAVQDNADKMLKTQKQKQAWRSEQVQLETHMKLIKEQAHNLRSSLHEASQQKEKLLVQVGRLQEENANLKEKVQQLNTANATAQHKHALQLEQMTSLHQSTVKELKKRLSECQDKVQNLYYQCKQSETKLEVANSAINDNLAQIRQLKEEKRTLQLQKEELKGDVKQLIDKNDQYFAAIETAKRKEIQLNTTLSDLQKEIIALQQRITENIANIADRDINISSLNDQLSQQRNINEEHVKLIDKKDLKLAEIQEKLKKYEKMLGIYKEELSRLKDNKQAQWQQMRGVYEEQILILEEKLKEFVDTKEKRNKTLLKTTKTEITEETVIFQVTSSPTVHEEMRQSISLEESTTSNAI